MASGSNSYSVADSISGNAQTITNIATLQTIEKDLFSNLESGLANNTLTPDQQQQIVQKINEISQLRTNLYQTMNSTLSFYQNNVTAARNTLSEQTNVINIVENELNQAKIRLQSITNDRYNKLRLVEINQYYGQRYNDHANIMKTIVLICIPIIIITLLVNNKILPESAYAVLLIVIAVVGIVFIWRQLLKAFSHDNMNYQEYDWNFSSSQAPTIDTTNPNGTNPFNPATPSATCVGALCCDTSSTYDASQNLCVPNASGSTSLSSTAAPAGTASVGTTSGSLLSSVTSYL
jgi:hypothetical protein